MSKKIFLSISLTLLLSVLSIGVAFAGEGEVDQPAFAPQRHRRVRVLGEITTINTADSSFGLTNRRGILLSFGGDSQTRYYGMVEDLKDLQIGMRAGVAGWVTENGSLIARAVAVPDPELLRIAGTLESVNSQANHISVQDRNGDSHTLIVSDETRFRGEVSGFDELRPGLVLLVLAEPAQGDHPVARWIAVPTRLQVRKFLGRVSEVDRAAGKFTLLTRRGDEIEIFVTQDTRFRSWQGTVQSLSDLEPEMIVAVAARTEADRSFRAIVIAAGNLPRIEFDRPVRGSTV